MSRRLISLVIVLQAACLQLAAGSASAQRAFMPERGEEFHRSTYVAPVELDAQRWRLVRIGDETPRTAIEDASIEASIRERQSTIPNTQVLWEGAGSTLVVEAPPGSRPLFPRAAWDRAFMHVQAFTMGHRSRIDRTWWAVYEPTVRGAKPRGVVVLLPGMLGTPEPVIESLLTGLRGRGWTVLRMLAHPSGFTEDTLVRTQGVRPERIAREFELNARCRLGAFVESVDGALREVEETPGARVLVAMSGGSLASPVVLASLRESGGQHEGAPVFDAAVLIGAGADVLTMSETSAYAWFLGGLRLDWPGEEADPAKLAEIVAAYREIDGMDPYHMAPRVRGVDMLLIQGERDEAVPARLGSLLWERLGRPERWLAPAGHEVLFFGFLPSRSRQMLDWIDATSHGHAGPVRGSGHREDGR